ncbi:glycosyl hydrolase family 28-related protein [Priestia megaterium]
MSDLIAKAIAKKNYDDISSLSEVVVSIKSGRFNAKGNGINDDSVAINAAISHVSSIGGGIVVIPKGTYIVSQSIILKDKVILQGMGKGISILKPSTTGFNLLVSEATYSGTPVIGTYTQVRDISFHGLADTLAGHPDSIGLNIDANKLIVLQNIDHVTFQNVEIKKSHSFSMLLFGCRDVVVDGCTVEGSARDSINVTGSTQVRITNNYIKYGSDDGIAVHFGQVNNAFSIDGGGGKGIIANNVLEGCYGIKAVGGNRLVITNNTMKNTLGYGIHIFRSDGEGKVDKYNIIVANNVVEDVVKLSSSVFDGIVLISEDKNELGVWDGTSFNTPENYTLWNDTKRGGDWFVNIHDNIITMKQKAGTVVKAGWRNENYTLDDRMNNAIFLQGNQHFLKIHSNIFYRALRGVYNNYSQGNGLPYDTDIINNKFIRIKEGITIPIPTSSTNIKNLRMAVKNNIFDLDPYHESGLRDVNGTWSDGVEQMCLYITNAKGILFEGNTLRNLNKYLQSNSYTEVFLGTNTFYQGTVRQIPNRQQNVIIEDGNKSSSTFGQILFTKYKEASAIPTAGTWDRGDKVYNSSPTASGYEGWICVTGGIANGTTWVASTAYTVGQTVYSSGKVYQCTVAGTSGTTAPSHSTGTAVDGTVTWQYLGILAVFKGYGQIQA